MGVTLKYLFIQRVGVLIINPVLLPKAYVTFVLMIRFFICRGKGEGQKAIRMNVFRFILMTIILLSSTEFLVAEEKKFHFNIPNLTVDAALNILARQSNTPLLLPFDQVKSISANGIQGQYTLTDALRLVLSGTGLNSKVSEHQVITVQFAKPYNQKSKDVKMRKNSKSSTALLGGVIGLLSTVSGTGQAIAEDQIANDTVKLEEILVTAQKRSQNLLDVPIAITAISGEELTSLGYNDARELAQHIPGLNWSGAISKPNIFIRGVGNSDFQSSSHNPVSLYVDGVLMGSSFGVSNLIFDLERVEVLKGPQGTLWGRNTTAGLINFVTRKAEVGSEANGNVSATLGKNELIEYEAAIGAPISDKVAVRVAYRHSEREGPFKSVNPDFPNSTGAWDWDAGRFNLVAEPNEKLSIDLSAYWGNLNNQTQPTKSLGVNGGCANPGVLGTTCSDRDGFVNSPNIYEVGNGFETFEKVNRYGMALTLDFDMGGASLISTSSYNDADRIAFNDNDGSPSVLSEGNWQDDFYSFSQEIRITSNPDSDMSWIIGAYYYKDQVEWYRASIRDTGVSGARFQNIDNTTAAAFGEITWQATEKLQLTGGIRLTYDKRTADQVRTFVFASQHNEFNSQERAFSNRLGDFIISVDDVERSWTKISGRLSALYNISDNANLWFTISRGFKGGDANSGAFTAGEFNISDPEFVTSYEAGIKSTGMDGRMRLSASAYYLDYTDKQVFTEVPGDGDIIINLTTLSNAGKLEIYGADVEGDVQVSNEFNLSFGASYIHSRFKEFISPGNGLDFSGNVTANTPEFTLDMIARYKIALENDATLSLQGDAVYKDDTFFTNDNDPLVKQEGFVLVGGNITYTSPDDSWYIRAWGKNLTQAAYFTSGFNFSFRGAILLNIGEPRSYGITAGFNF
ncbi:MAG: hypothetical protein COB49_04680 [Alphaproteobacteria bacterium]|nr:MAG: hypothetical protein COB49_04680 [Alphaproteobacteria bacterium]